MARGRGGKKAYKPTGRVRRPGAGVGAESEEEGSEGEEDAKFKPRSRGMSSQANTVGMLPPSDSEEDDEPKEAPPPGADGAGASGTAAAEAPKPAEPTKPAAPAPKPAAKKPVVLSSSEEDDSDDSGSDESSDDEPPPAKGKGAAAAAAAPPPGATKASAPRPAADYLSEQSSRKPKGIVEERDPEVIRKEMEQLTLIKAKREADRLRRVEKEGWDRFAAVTETNRPPGTVPSDHPSKA